MCSGYNQLVSLYYCTYLVSETVLYAPVLTTLSVDCVRSCLTLQNYTVCLLDCAVRWAKIVGVGMAGDVALAES